jgi:hypothetical protein
MTDVFELITKNEEIRVGLRRPIPEFYTFTDKVGNSCSGFSPIAQSIYIPAPVAYNRIAVQKVSPRLRADRMHSTMLSPGLRTDRMHSTMLSPDSGYDT